MLISDAIHGSRLNSSDFLGITIPKYVTNWVAQRQLPDFIEKLHHATLEYADKKIHNKWGKNRDPGFEYPSDVRLDEFNHDEIEDNVNKSGKKKKQNDIAESSDEDEDEIDEPEPKRATSWWSYFSPYYYLH